MYVVSMLAMFIASEQRALGVLLHKALGDGAQTAAARGSNWHYEHS